MEIDSERAAALDPWSIRVYQQLQASYPIDAIKDQFDSIENITSDDVRWILIKGKSRYVGYYEYYKANNKAEAKTMIWAGPALTLFMVLILYLFGWPTLGRLNGRIVWGFLAGIGIFGYGVWCWIDAEPKGRRTDVDNL